MSEKTQILTPVGRLVQGHPFEAQTKDAENKPLVYKTGAQAGQPRVNYYMAIAIPKTDPGVNAFYGQLLGTAKTAFPSLFNPATGTMIPTFAMKVTDGDGMDAKNQPNSRHEGFAGCWIFRFSNGYAPKCYTKDGAAIITEPTAIKRGDYIRIAGTVDGNGSAQQPGIFLNGSLVELIGYGEEIQTGPDGASIFGGAPVAALPAGASATPVAGATPIAPVAAAPAAPVAPVAAAPVAAAPVAPVAAAPVAPVTPAPDILTGAPAAPAPSAAAPYTMTDKATAQGITYEALVAKNWTPQQMFEHGYISDFVPF